MSDPTTQTAEPEPELALFGRSSARMTALLDLAFHEHERQWRTRYEAVTKAHHETLQELRRTREMNAQMQRELARLKGQTV